MSFTTIDIINIVALLINIAGTFLMFYFSPVINSQTYLYNRSELPDIRERDARKNKMVKRGMLLLLIGFVLQAIAIFFGIAYK